MGIYSLENFEKYKTYKIRPLPLLDTPFNPRSRQINFITFSWSELEPSRGQYCLAPVFMALTNTINPVLILEPILPLWVHDHIEDCFSSLIRRVGSGLTEDKRLLGVVISTMNSSRQVWEAFVDSFEPVFLLADIHNSSLISYLTRNKISFGLIVKCCEENWIDCCEAFARQNLQNIWKTNPVILQITDNVCGENISREALRWHVAYTNLPIDIGYHFVLRRLTYPKVASSNGALPLRFWFVNHGSSPCYRYIKIKLLLSKEDRRYEIPINAATNTWLIGDITHNEILHLPDMIPGKYAVSLGVFFEDNRSLYLNIQGEEHDGFYGLGTLDIDLQNRDYLFDIWDNYYPDGYYPLEDPQAPESSG